MVQKRAMDFSVVARLRAVRPRVRGFIPGKANGFLFLRKRPDRLWGLTPSLVQWVPESRVLRIKRPGRGADHPHRVQWLRMD